MIYTQEAISFCYMNKTGHQCWNSMLHRIAKQAKCHGVRKFIKTAYVMHMQGHPARSKPKHMRSWGDWTALDQGWREQTNSLSFKIWKEPIYPAGARFRPIARAFTIDCLMIDLGWRQPPDRSWTWLAGIVHNSKLGMESLPVEPRQGQTIMQHQRETSTTYHASLHPMNSISD